VFPFFLRSEQRAAVAPQLLFPICLRLGRQRFPRTSRSQIEWSRTASHSLACQNPPTELRMSVAAVPNALFLTPNLLSVKSHAHIFKQQFQQLGHDQLATDLKSGNLPGAQKDFQPGPQQSSAASGHHHHSAGSAGFSISQNSLEQLFSRLGQDLQSGNLSKAQSAYAPLQQEFTQLRSALSSTLSSAASGNALNVKLRFRQGKLDLPCLFFPCSCFPLVPHFVFLRQRAIFSLFRGIFRISVQRDPARFISLREQRDEGSRPPPLQN
jgi:hypothetical protein